MATLKGVSASPGAVIGPASILRRISLDIPEAVSARTKNEELADLRRATAESLHELQRIHDSAQSRLKKQEAEIFVIQMEMLDDPALIGGIEEAVGKGLTVISAAARTAASLAAKFEAMDNEYFRERAADVRDVAGRLIKNLSETQQEDEAPRPPGIIVAEELQPSDFSFIDSDNTAGIATEKGGVTSHASILARSLGIPCVVGVQGLLAAVTDGCELALDAGAGTIVVSPDDSTRRHFSEMAERDRMRREAAFAGKDEPASALDGRRILIYANAGSVDSINKAIENGAEGIGLFRTEFLFIGRKTMPSEDEQFAVYSEAARAGAGKPVTIRLLDIGGDKPAEYLALPPEENPYLGMRAIRVLLERRDVLRAQVRAILRASLHGDVLLLVPMIADAEEMVEVRKEVEECRARLAKEGVDVPPVPVGTMIEIPSAAICAVRLAELSDFFSIGTNDLTQYCMAADRGNAAVNRLYRTSHPAVLMLIARTIHAARRAGIKVSICGEAASLPELIPKFIGMGVDVLSVSPSLVPDIKQCVRETNPIADDEC